MTGLITYEASRARRQEMLASSARRQLVLEARAARRAEASPSRPKLRPFARLVFAGGRA
jgi:hypothetical protein